MGSNQKNRLYLELGSKSSMDEKEMVWNINKATRTASDSPVRASQNSEPDQQNGAVVVEEVTKPKLQKPKMYKVVLLNDDYTPMEFVIEVLQIFFTIDREKATQIMMAVHTVGRATCGIYTMDIAETKSVQVNHYAQECEHPLISIIEAAD